MHVNISFDLLYHHIYRYTPSTHLERKEVAVSPVGLVPLTVVPSHIHNEHLCRIKCNIDNYSSDSMQYIATMILLKVSCTAAVSRETTRTQVAVKQL